MRSYRQLHSGVGVDKETPRERYSRLESVTKDAVCENGHSLVVAFTSGQWELRCKCGFNPVMRLIVVKSLRQIYEQEGIEALGAIDRMQLFRKLHKTASRLETDGQFNTDTHRLLDRLQREMEDIHGSTDR